MPLHRAAFRTTGRYVLGRVAEAFATPLRVAGRLLAGRDTSPPDEWHRGLIIGHPHIGDVLYRTASLEQLSTALPGCEWHYLTSPSSAPVLGGNPHLASVHPLSRGDEAWQLAPGAFEALRALDFDVALCTNSIRYYADLALATRLRIPNRVAFTHKGLSGLATRSAPIAYPSPYPAYFRSMVASLAERAPDWSLRPRLYLDDADRARAVAMRADCGIGDDVPLVACTLTMRQRGEIWPPDHWLAALGIVHRETGAHVAFCGAEADAPFLETVARRAPFPSYMMAGRLDLRTFAAFLSGATALLCTDSGPRHLGNAVGLPVLFFRHLGFCRAEAAAYCDTEVDLSPADLELADLEAQRAALRAVPPTDVASHVVRAIAERRVVATGGAAEAS